ncbi:MAG TPA: ATP-binding protein [Kofleriaceae bacterium]|nr:ATP-binding protein [Kofleriaceae bacterium]
MKAISRLLSAGVTDALPERLTRHLRVTNALALIGAVLTLSSLPIDLYGRAYRVVVVDVLGSVLFTGCWMLNTRGHTTLSRVLFLLTANAVILFGVIGAGATTELRAVFLPLSIAPFLMFGLHERGKLAVFAVMPAIAYFVTAAIEPETPENILKIYVVYAPLLAFTLIVSGAIVFAYVERTASERLVRTQARAAQTERLASLGQMASGIAHEIRNPLQAIQLAAGHVVERSDDPALVKQLGERIQRIVARADRIIDALRSLSRDASKDPFTDTPVERVVGEALELCEKRFSEQNVELAVARIPPELVISCRSVQLSQVLVNLMSNAFDAVSSQPTRWVKVEAQANGGWLVIAVSDSGAGIPPEARDRLFDPFYTTKGPDRGTGLGLSLSRSIVEAHYGTLELDADAPYTRFVMRVPLVQGGAAVSPARQVQ